MSRAYDNLPGKVEKQQYLCPWKIFAGNKDLVIAINDWAKRIHFTLKEQEQYCDTECPSKNECNEKEKKDVINVFSPKLEESQPIRLRWEKRERGVMEANGIIIEDDKKKGEAIGDSSATR